MVKLVGLFVEFYDLNHKAFIHVNVPLFLFFVFKFKMPKGL